MERGEPYGKEDIVEPGNGRERRDRSVHSLKPYLLVGLSLCLLVQLVFWLQIGGGPLPMGPFFWAYSQVAILALIVKGSSRVVYAILWGLAYLGVALGLWLTLERGGRQAVRAAWLRAVVGWVAVEIAVTLFAWLLLERGILEIE